ncbi:putative reverse transcriptase domain-containing protein [Tanacetum coccineum]
MEIVHETTEKIIQAAQDRQKSYANRRRKPLEFEVEDKVMLKVSPWKGVIRFGKRGKLNPRYIGPFKILAKVGTLAYQLDLPEQLSRVHSTLHVSNLKKCFVDEPLAIPLDEIQIDDKLNFIKEPVEIIDREVKRLKQSRIPIVKLKLYHMIDDDEPILEKGIGTTIEWLRGKCLTQKILKKKPKKGSKNAKPITKTEDCESFFNFFSPPEVPDDAEEIEEDEIRLDYSNIGMYGLDLWMRFAKTDVTDPINGFEVLSDLKNVY